MSVIVLLAWLRTQRDPELQKKAEEHQARLEAKYGDWLPIIQLGALIGTLILMSLFSQWVVM